MKHKALEDVKLAGFHCRSVEQTAWLLEVAKKAHGAATTRVFVVAEVDQPHVVAYYAWCMASVRTLCPDRPASRNGQHCGDGACSPRSLAHAQKTSKLVCQARDA